MATTYKWGLQFVTAMNTYPYKTESHEDCCDDSIQWADRLEDINFGSGKIDMMTDGKAFFERLILRKTWTVSLKNPRYRHQYNWTTKRWEGLKRTITHQLDAYVEPSTGRWISDHEYNKDGTRNNKLTNTYSKRKSLSPTKRHEKELKEHPIAWKFSNRFSEFISFGQSADRIQKGEHQCRTCFNKKFEDHPVIKNPVWTLCKDFEGCEEMADSEVHAHCPNHNHRATRNLLTIDRTGLFDSEHLLQYDIGLHRSRKGYIQY